MHQNWKKVKDNDKNINTFIIPEADSNLFIGQICHYDDPISGELHIGEIKAVSTNNNIKILLIDTPGDIVVVPMSEIGKSLKLLWEKV